MERRPPEIWRPAPNLRARRVASWGAWLGHGGACCDGQAECCVLGGGWREFMTTAVSLKPVSGGRQFFTWASFLGASIACIGKGFRHATPYTLVAHVMGFL